MDSVYISRNLICLFCPPIIFMSEFSCSRHSCKEWNFPDETFSEQFQLQFSKCLPDSSTQKKPHFLLCSLLHCLFANVFFLYLPFKSYSAGIILKQNNFLNKNEQLLEKNFLVFKGILPYQEKNSVGLYNSKRIQQSNRTNKQK